MGRPETGFKSCCLLDGLFSKVDYYLLLFLGETTSIDTLLRGLGMFGAAFLVMAPALGLAGLGLPVLGLSLFFI
jgi:hypothetical protein